MEKRKRPAKSAVERGLEDFLFGNEGKRVHEDTVPKLSNMNANRAVAWNDEDDEAISVNVSTTKRLKKLDPDRSNPNVSGLEISEMLHDRFQTSTLDWAQYDGAEFETPDILQSSKPLAQSASSTQLLPSRKISVVRTCDGNAAEPSNGCIAAVRFHPSKPLLLVAAKDKHFKIFNVDGTKNEKLAGVKIADLPISDAYFLGQSEVIVTGRKPFYCSYDVESGSLRRIPGILGKQLKSLENLSVSPSGGLISFYGTSGYAHICDGRSKSWISDVKMNSPVRALKFVDEQTIIASGLDADVYWWDVRMAGKCLMRFKNEDGTPTSCLGASFSSENKALAVGSESGVVTVYDCNAPFPANPPRLAKSLLNLTTRVDSIAFHPSNQLLAIGSSEKNDQLRLVHLPSLTVFTNWPTDTTPIRKLQCCEFSPDGKYLGIGSNTGKVLLYRLQHFVK